MEYQFSVFSLSVSGLICIARRQPASVDTPQAVWAFPDWSWRESCAFQASCETQQTPPCFQEIFSFLFFFLFVNINSKQNRLNMKYPWPICHNEKSVCRYCSSFHIVSQSEKGLKQSQAVFTNSCCKDQSWDADILLWAGGGAELQGDRKDSGS